MITTDYSKPNSAVPPLPVDNFDAVVGQGPEFNKYIGVRPTQETIPDALKHVDQWVLFKEVAKPKGGKNKIPYQPNGRKASSTNPKTWSEFTEVWAAYEESAGKYAGVGFVVSESDAFIGGDLDHCRNAETGDLTPKAKQIVDGIVTYWEVTPSGTGIRFFAQGDQVRSFKGNGIEIYTSGRYLTVTGERLGNTDAVAEIDAAQVSRLHELAVGNKRKAESVAIKSGDDRIVKALKAHGLYQRATENGRHIVTCPWSGEHHGGDLTGTVYMEGGYNEEFPHAAFTCQHTSCNDKRRLPELLGELGLSEARATNGPDEWPEPLPLPALHPPVPPFDPELLPDRLRPWLSDIAERMQCPPEFPAVSALVSLASLVGRQVGIMPKRYDDWLVVPNLWGAVVGRPGIMKTPALDEPMKPLHRLKEAAREDHGREMEDCEVALDVHQAKLDAAKSKLTSAAKKGGDVEGCAAALRNLREGELKPPTMRRYLTNDATPEKLGELLSENPTGMLVYRDELVSWLKGLDREGREEGRGFYLQGWNGTGSYTFDRIIRGTVHIEAVCVSMLGGIQPGPLSDYVYHATHNGSGNDGLLQRFQLLVWPDDSGAWRNVDRWPDTEAKNAAFEVFARLDNIDLQAIGADTTGEIPFLRFSHEAQELFDEWRAELETQKLRSGEPEPLEAHMAKYRSLGPSLALLFHLIDEGRGPVTAKAAARAFDWCEYLEGHARRVYGASSIEGLDSAHALADKIKAGRLPAEFKPKDVYLKGWAKLDKEGTDKALGVLVDCGWLNLRTVPTGGRPSKVVALNPKLVVNHG